jgi:hypothetical protein
MLYFFLSLAAIALLSAAYTAYIVWKENGNTRRNYAINENFANLEIDGIDFNVGVEDYCLN